MLIALSQGSISIPSWGAVCNKKSKRQLVSSQVQTVSSVLINSNWHQNMQKSVKIILLCKPKNTCVLLKQWSLKFKAKIQLRFFPNIWNNDEGLYKCSIEFNVHHWQLKIIGKCSFQFCLIVSWNGRLPKEGKRVSHYKGFCLTSGAPF